MDRTRMKNNKRESEGIHMKKTGKLLCFVALVIVIVKSISCMVIAAPTNTSFSTALLLSSDLGDQKTITGISTGTSVYYYINVTLGQHISAAIYNMSSSANYDLRLYNSSQNQVASSTRTSISIDSIAYTSTYSGKYYLSISATSVPNSNANCNFVAVKSCGVSGTSSTNSSYNRKNACNYMELYTSSPNPAYNYYSGMGGDCTNFASQVVKYGGMAPITGSSSSNSCWYAYSETWKSATKFTNHWGTNSVGSGNKRAYSCQYFSAQGALNNYQTFISNIKKGDIIQLCNPASGTARTHSMVVYQKYSDDLRMAQHSTDEFRYLSSVLNNNYNKFIVVIRIKQG